MLVKLYALPPCDADIAKLAQQGIQIRRAMAYEFSIVTGWVKKAFNSLWADECRSAFGGRPVGCYIAVKEKGICGFCCLDVTFRNFIGPIGVQEDCRSQGVGRGLLLSAARELHLSGYAYAIIGDVGEPVFFKKAVDAIDIPNSTPGAYPARV